ncbi:MAG: iron-containing alcohol dehydrogenase [Verrucomicrobia bacterium]|nr:iron-containing alcohol dehydrogenase [Verrucomicrobiota bacterium]
MLSIRLPLPRFLSAGEVFLGPGSIGALRALNASKAVLLASKSLVEDADMTSLLQKNLGALEVLTLAAHPGEPTLSGLDTILRELSVFKPDWIVAVGGGSVLDTAKLAWTFYEHPDADLEVITRPFVVPGLRGKSRFVAVPTTAGSGSEVSSSAVFFDAETGQKRFLVSHELLPDLVILDPVLTTKVPPRAVASAGLDALAHAIEGYVSRFTNPFADLIAEKAASVIFETLPVTFAERSDLEARLRMMEAAMLAGWVQNLKVPGVGHAVAHQMASFGIPHGIATGALLGASITANCSDEGVRHKYRRLAHSLNLVDEDQLIERIQALRLRLDVAQPLSTGISNGRSMILEKLDEICRNAMVDPCAHANPVPVTPEVVRGLLYAAL